MNFARTFCWIASILLMSSACASNVQKEFQIAVTEEEESPAELRERSYARTLAQFGETPLLVDAAQSAAAIGDVLEEVRVVIFDAEGNGWFVSLNGTILSDVDPYSILLVSMFESKRYDYFSAVDAIKKNGYYKYQDVLTNYLTYLDYSDFSDVKALLLSASFFDMATTVEQDILEVKSSPCSFSGRRYFVEAIFDDRRHLIFRTECNQGFNEGLRIIAPSLNVTRHSIGVIGTEVIALLASVKTGNVD